MTMPARIRDRLADHWAVRGPLRLLRKATPEPTVTISGYATRSIPASVVPFIVDTIDPRGIHHDADRLHLDGGMLHDLAEGIHPGLTLAQLAGLKDAGDIGCESAAMTFRGDVYIDTDDAELVARANRRGAETGFAYAVMVMGLASHAASKSRRPLSGAR